LGLLGTCAVLMLVSKSISFTDETSLPAEMIEINAPKGTTAMDIVMVLTGADKNSGLLQNFRNCVTSLLKYCSSQADLRFHIVSDKISGRIAQSIISKALEDMKLIITTNVTIEIYDSAKFAQQVASTLGSTLDYFRYKKTSYYGGELFFASLVLDDLMPHLDRVVLLDVDLLFKADISELWAYFEKFNDRQMIGICREQQPIYRHVFAVYRSKNPDTKIGMPPPSGISGFNSGVVLLDLAKIRRSNEYRDLIRTGTRIDTLVKKYEFKGHLGDQDVYTLLSVNADYIPFFYVLPCGWNRQLCTWWRDHGYADVFDSFWTCNEPIKIYHGNCKTAIPESILNFLIDLLVVAAEYCNCVNLAIRNCICVNLILQSETVITII